MAEPFGLETSIAGVFHCKGSQRLITVSILVFFDVLPHLRMQCLHPLFENAIRTPLQGMPEYRPCKAASRGAGHPNYNHS